MKRYEVTITYQVDSSRNVTGGELARHLSELIFEHTCGGERQNLVSETDFRLKEITHPANSDRPQGRSV